MPSSEPQEIAFTGVRLRVDSAKSYDELVNALFADIGATPVPIGDFSKTPDSWESYKQQVESHVGESGFTLFTMFDHGRWIKKTGINRNALRLILGNPLIAITMLRHDVSAGLFAPVELLVLQEDDGGSSITYVKPSSLMVVEPNPPLLAAAQELDRKLAALVAKVTATP
jgi:uncharacterized protein (DUF302 family)